MSVRSALSARDPVKARIEAELAAKGATVFAKIDHAAGATAAGMTLPLIIFGNASAGTPLLQASQRAGIDLPLKALVWEDGTVRIG